MIASWADIPSNTAVAAHGLGKRYTLCASPRERLSLAVAGRPPDESRVRWALRDVSFQVRRGEAYGIIGENGSGKSTLLKIICGVFRPTLGCSIVKGRVLGLLELGAGLNMELTGRNNVVTSTKLLGFPDDYAQSRMEEIQAFADIGEFFDLPVKLYSSGMLVRLAFSLYLFLEPDVLVIDEAMSVGDHFFQRKCAAAIARYRQRGATILFVSHSLGTVKAICDRALLLKAGRVVIEDGVDKVVATYLDRQRSYAAHAPMNAVQAPEKTATTEVERVLAEMAVHPQDPREKNWRAVAMRFMDQFGSLASFFEMGEPARLLIALNAPKHLPLPVVTVEIIDRFERTITGRKAMLTHATRVPFGVGEAIVVAVDLTLNLCSGEYVARVLVGDQIPAAATTSTPISIYNRQTVPPFYGIAGLPATFRFGGRTTDGEGVSPE